MTSEKTSEQSCSTCGANSKGRLQRIIEGLKNYVFRDPEVEQIAKYRALRCATCDFNKMEICSKCNCAIPAKIRSTEEQCPIGRW